MTTASDCDVRARSVCSDLRLRHAKAGPATSSTSIMGELSECLWWHFLLSPVTYQHNYQYRFAILETARILFASTNCQRNFFSSILHSAAAGSRVTCTSLTIPAVNATQATSQEEFLASTTVATVRK